MLVTQTSGSICSACSTGSLVLGALEALGSLASARQEALLSVKGAGAGWGHPWLAISSPRHCKPPLIPRRVQEIAPMGNHNNEVHDSWQLRSNKKASDRGTKERLSLHSSTYPPQGPVAVRMPHTQGQAKTRQGPVMGQSKCLPSCCA